MSANKGLPAALVSNAELTTAIAKKGSFTQVREWGRGAQGGAGRCGDTHQLLCS